MFVVDHCHPLHTLTRVKAPLANRSDYENDVLFSNDTGILGKRSEYTLFFHGRLPVIMQAFSHPNPKPTFAYKHRSYLTKTIDSLS